MHFPKILFKRPHHFFPAGLLVLLVAWWLVWFVGAFQLRSSINGWIEEGRNSGYSITYDNESLFGFPRHIVLRFTNLKWKNTDGILFNAGDIDIGAALWKKHYFTAKFKGRAEIDAPLNEADRTLVLSGTDGSAEVNLDANGFWRFSHIKIKQAEVGRKPDYVFHSDELNAAAERPEIEPKDHHDVGLTLTGTADHVSLPTTMPQSFGNTMQRLELNLRVMGAVPDYRKRDSIDHWNQESGIIECDNLHIEWGPLQMAAKGTLGLDDDLQPEGAFASTLGNPEGTIKALKDAGFIAERQENMLQSAIDLFSKPSKEGNVRGMQVPIAVQLGGLFLGPVKIFTFPQIEWSEGPK
jgi:hypothetical protein